MGGGGTAGESNRTEGDIPIRWGKWIGLGRWGWDAVRQGISHVIHHALLPLIHHFSGCPGATVGGAQGTKKRNRNCKAPSHPEVTFVGSGSPPDGSGGDGPSSCPRMDEWVRGRAVCYVPVDAHVVSEGTVGAGGGGHIIFPEGCTVAVPQSGLEAKEPLMPRQATKFKWSPGGRMEIFVCV